MKHLTFPLLALLICSTAESVRAADEFDPKARAATISPYLTEEAVAVGRLDLSRVNLDAILKQVVEIVNPPKPKQADMLEANKKTEELLVKLKEAGVNEIYAVVNLSIDPSRLAYLIVPVKQGGDHRAVAGILFGGDPQGPTSYEEAKSRNFRGPQSHEICAKLGNTVFCGSKSILEQLKDNTPQSRPELEKAFAAAGDTTAQFVVVLTSDSRRVIREMLPKLPPELGGASGETLMDALQWAAVGINSPPNLSVNLVIQSKDQHSAQALQNLLKAVYRLLGQRPDVKREFPMYEQIAEVLIPKVEGNRLLLSLTKENQGVNKLVTLVSQPLDSAREEARRAKCKNNLKQFGIAMHNFHDVYRSFPPSASYDKKGKKLLSWRVYVLPYLDANDLYKQFHLDEPWDSDHNKTLIEKMPDVFACPSAKLSKKGMTTYLAPLGKKTIFSGKIGVPISDITDGTSNTFMIVDADPEHAVVWTKPDDLEIDLEKPLQGLAGQHVNGFWSLFCDGSVRFVPKSIDLKTLRALFTRSGRDVVSKFYHSPAR
ncbi:MAG: DUF1559 domain-containing protein [Planctomycetes bacterium]|nr:DUF1559 domain-containing protein [Planctomycetota bacterium]